MGRHCKTLQNTATHCKTLQNTATHCNTYARLQWVMGSRVRLIADAHNAMSIFIAVVSFSAHCNTLQHAATHCSTLQHSKMHCVHLLAQKTDHHKTMSNQFPRLFCSPLGRTPTYCNTLQRTWTHGNILQYAATHCNTVQYTVCIHWPLPTLMTRWAFIVVVSFVAHCNTLQHTATQWVHPLTFDDARKVVSIHCGRLFCNTLQRAATHYNTLQHIATYCNTPPHTATHCNALQHTATHCNTLHYNTLCALICLWWRSRRSDDSLLSSRLQHTATHRNTLQHTATQCNTLPCTAAYSNTLQHIATQYNTLCAFIYLWWRSRSSDYSLWSSLL